MKHSISHIFGRAGNSGIVYNKPDGNGAPSLILFPVLFRGGVRSLRQKGCRIASSMQYGCGDATRYGPVWQTQSRGCWRQHPGRRPPVGKHTGNRAARPSTGCSDSSVPLQRGKPAGRRSTHGRDEGRPGPGLISAPVVGLSTKTVASHK